MAGVILPDAPRSLHRHAAHRQTQGIRLNVNVLGEAVLGEEEAARRLSRVLSVLDHPSVDYVSVKISSICSQLDVLRFDHEVERIATRLRRLYAAADGYRPAKFVNLDMEEYRDLELTLAVFRRVLDEPAFRQTRAGIVLQAYLPDSLPALEDLCAWARRRRDQGGEWIKVRLVKGANLAMEQVDAEIHGWSAAPFSTKAETDANYKRLLDVALDPANHGAVRVGVASHNLFEIGWAIGAGRPAPCRRPSRDRDAGRDGAGRGPGDRRLRGGPLALRPTRRSRGPGVGDRLPGPAPRRELRARQLPDPYVRPVCRIPEWRAEAARFRTAVEDRHLPVVATRRVQRRQTETTRAAAGATFTNEPDTDFSIPANRRWIAAQLDAFRRGGVREFHPVVGGRTRQRPGHRGRDRPQCAG